jgi:hypothetical protein
MHAANLLIHAANLLIHAANLALKATPRIRLPMTLARRAPTTKVRYVLPDSDIRLQ